MRGGNQSIYTIERPPPSLVRPGTVAISLESAAEAQRSVAAIATAAAVTAGSATVAATPATVAAATAAVATAAAAAAVAAAATAAAAEPPPPPPPPPPPRSSRGRASLTVNGRPPYGVPFSAAMAACASSSFPSRRSRSLGTAR